MFKNEPDLLTRKQCQDLLHISKSKMLELIHNNYIPAICTLVNDVTPCF